MSRALRIKLFRDLKLRIVTLVALVLVLSIGVSSYISMSGVYKDLNHAREIYYRRYQLADFTIDLKRAPEIIIQRLKHLPNILRLENRIKTEVMTLLPSKAYSNKNSHPLPGVVLSLPVPRQEMINNVMLYKGRWFSNSYVREVIVDEQFAKARHLLPGDRIKIRLPDREDDFLIVGTSYSPEFVLILPPGGMIAPEPGGYAVLYMPYHYLQEYSNLNGSFNQLVGITRDRSTIAIKNSMTLLTRLWPFLLSKIILLHILVSLKSFASAGDYETKYAGCLIR